MIDYEGQAFWLTYACKSGLLILVSRAKNIPYRVDFNLSLCSI